MRSDMRMKHDVSLRAQAIRLFDAGYGNILIGSMLGIPRDTVRQWHRIYMAIGGEALLSEKRKNNTYPFEVKVAAARAVVDGGMTKAEAMAAFGIASSSPLEHWCRAYRAFGEEALKPKPKGRPKGSAAQPKELTREQELEVQVRKLQAENAYLKKLAALRAEEALRTGPRPRW